MGKEKRTYFAFLCNEVGGICIKSDVIQSEAKFLENINVNTSEILHYTSFRSE